MLSASIMSRTASAYPVCFRRTAGTGRAGRWSYAEILYQALYGRIQRGRIPLYVLLRLLRRGVPQRAHSMHGGNPPERSRRTETGAVAAVLADGARPGVCQGKSGGRHPAVPLSALRQLCLRRLRGQQGPGERGMAGPLPCVRRESPWIGAVSDDWTRERRRPWDGSAACPR